MKKNTYILDNIDCAACANKIEQKINNLDGVFSSSLNFITLKLFVTFDENIINDEEIETNIHKALNGVQIVKKNNQEFIDNYQEPNVFKKILFKGKRK